MDLLLKMVEYSLIRCLCYFTVGPKGITAKTIGTEGDL